MGEAKVGLAGIEAALAGRGRAMKQAGGPAPVELWNPPYCGEIGLKIAADGLWYYQGSPICRKRLVKLFASVLRKDEDGRHYLVTPVEKIGIEVEDAPFLAVDMSVEGSGRCQRLKVRTNLDESIVIGPDHLLYFSTVAGNDGIKPYVTVRGRLTALFTRSLAYELLLLSEEKSDDDGPVPGIWSNDVFFPFPVFARATGQ